MEAELKVVITVKGEQALVGIQGSATDPVLEVVEGGDLYAILAQVPAIVDRAKAKWASTPKNPTYERPPEPPRPAAPPRTITATARPAEPAQPTMF